MKTIWIILAAVTASTTLAEEKTGMPAAAKPAAPSSISVQEMIETGPPQMRLHALAMITQNRVKELDDSYLKTFAICAEDKNLPIRSVAARIVGSHWIEAGKENPEAISLLLKFSHDEAEDVRFSAVYYGLANVQNKSDAVIKRLIEITDNQREPTLNAKIKEGLKGDKERVKAILNQQLNDPDENRAIRAFEIYEDLTGETPDETERFHDMPSSRPMLFIFSTNSDAPEKTKADLERELKKIGIANPDLSFSGPKKQVLLLKTYLTGDRLLVSNTFHSEHPDFPLTQQLWLSPKLEAQMNAMKSE
jgi:hypothetical protein